MPAQQVLVGEPHGERPRRGANVGGVLVEHHRALAAGVVDEPRGLAKLQHALAFRREIAGSRQRVPLAEPHAPAVYCCRVEVGTHFEPTAKRLDFGLDAAPDRLVCGDALGELAAWRDGSIDAIYIDPPFGTGLVQQGRGHRYIDRPDDPDAFVTWLLPYLEHARRVLTHAGSLFVHLDYRAVHYVKVALDRVFGRERFVNELIWCYAVGGKGRKGFGRKHDTILWYARTADWAFYPDAVKIARRGGSHMRVVTGEDGQPVQEKTDRKTGRVYRYTVSLGKVPEDWWTDIEPLNHSDRERIGWPSQKPERLLERILGAVTVPGDRVADWFVGSGTAAAVAQRTGRRFVAFDREPAAISLAAARLAAQGTKLAAEGAPPPPITIERHP